MNGKRFYSTAFAVVAGTVFCIATFNCDGPMAPITSGWIRQTPATVPGDRVIACSEKAVYFLTQTKIYKYDGGAVKIDYQAPPGITFYDIGFSGDAGWAVGTMANKGFIVRYNGSRWLDVNLPVNDIKVINNVIPADGGSCWLLTSPDHFLYFWDGTDLRKENAGEDLNNVVYSPTSGILYACRSLTSLKFELVITADRGRTWVTEEMPTAVNGFEYTEIWDMAAVGDALYFIVTPEHDVELGGFEVMIIKRVGAPGGGEYEISFGSPIATDFEGLKSLAFCSPTKGVAVGYRTSLVYDEPRWYKEEKPSLFFNLVTADPRGGFWASESDGIYYHP